jgi:hypothetical protein
MGIFWETGGFEVDEARWDGTRLVTQVEGRMNWRAGTFLGPCHVLLGVLTTYSPHNDLGPLEIWRPAQDLRRRTKELVIAERHLRAFSDKTVEKAFRASTMCCQDRVARGNAESQ